jgi:hypothetical protein|uniref:Uncharacterized protein n=1 Tax=Siphoviridae sp. ctnNB1 TaxID=2825660 RepID=A0A8S5UV81_9CAUD|nr:MAG TPA: hypothetical protein [Siphoviridae sp. ctnNB1]
MDFAFFVVNFGYTKGDYDELTRREKAFIYKAWENKIVSETTHIYNAAFTAGYNVNRPKRKRALKLWRKAGVMKANMETVEENLKIAEEVEKKEGKGWVQRIFEANGLKLPERRKNG